MSQTPSICRFVQVKGVDGFDEGYMAAVITGVRANGTIDVTVFPSGAVPYPQTELAATDWRWPPRDEPEKEPVPAQNTGAGAGSGSGSTDPQPT